VKGLLIVAALGLASALAGCGADGAPVRPSLDVGVSVGSGGVSVKSRAKVQKGPVTVGVEL